MANHLEATSYPSSNSFSVVKTGWGAVATILSVVYTAVCGVPAVVFAATGRHQLLSYLTRLWAWLIIKTCGITVEIEGLERLRGSQNFLIVSNHQSFFDIFAACVYLPGEVRFVAKRELLKIPLVGYAMKHGDHVIIDRQAGGREIRSAIEISRKGYNLVVFAEGHRFSDNRVHEFADGAAWLAIMTRLPAVPMAISGSGAFFPRLAKVVVPGGRMRMNIGDPIPTTGLKSADREELTRKLEDAVRAMFVEEL